jgi:glycosyltransferase involved in cell wall biosynthesis
VRRLLWVTNLPAPYRFAAWDELARSGVDLEVWVLARNTLNRAWGQGFERPYLTLLPARTVTVGPRQTYLTRVPFSDLAKRMGDRDAVVIGGWQVPLFWRVALIATIRRLPRVLFYESTGASHQFPSGPVSWIRRAFLRWGGDVVLVPGTAAATTVAAHGVPESRIVTTFNSIDQSAVQRAVERAEDRRTPPPMRFCYVGQLIKRKNVAALLEAFWSMDDSATELHIVGEGPLRESLEELSRQLGRPDSVKKVVWHGGLPPDLALDRMVTAHVLVLPSTVEVWGLVVNEALAAGLHVVVSTTCGVAPEVADMAGVHLSGTAPESIRAAMEATASTWNGWIEDPKILRTGSPSRFASDVMAAVRLAAVKRRNR